MADVTPAFVERALREAGTLPAGVSMASAVAKPMALDGFLSDVGRLHLEYEPPTSASSLPSTVIVKLVSSRPEAMEAASSAGLYRAEMRFFQRFAETAAVGAPHCYYSAEDEASGHVVLLLEDLDERPGLYFLSQVDGIGQREMEGMAAAMGALHAQHWSWGEDDRTPDDDAALPAWLSHATRLGVRDPANAANLERYLASKFVDAASCEARGVGGECREACLAAMARGAQLGDALRSGPQTLCHNDARSDNIFWGDANAVGGVVFLDWQIMARNVGAADLAWVTTNSVTDEPPSEARDRRYVELYWRALTSRGVDTERYPLEACWRDYLLGVAWSYTLLIHIVGLGASADELLENELCREIHDRCMRACYALKAHEVPLQRLV